MAAHKRSIVWSFFTAINQNVANCDVCKKAVHYCGNSTNLFKHIQKHEKEHGARQRKKEEVGEVEV